MKIAVLGTGVVGQTIAEKLAALEHDVTMGTRDVKKALATTGIDASNMGPYHDRFTEPVF